MLRTKRYIKFTPIVYEPFFTSFGNGFYGNIRLFTSDVFWFYNVRKNDGNAGMDPEFTNPLNPLQEGGGAVLYFGKISEAHPERNTTWF